MESIYDWDKELSMDYDILVDLGIATEDEIALVTSICGTNIKTFQDILFSRTGYRSFDQLEE